MKSILLKIMYYILGALNKLLTYEAIKKTEQIPRKFKKTGHNCKFSPQSFFRGEEYISIGDSFKSGIHFRLEAFKEYNQQHFFPSIEIGDNVSIQDFCHIGCIEKIVVGSGTITRLVAAAAAESDAEQRCKKNTKKSVFHIAPPQELRE